MSGKVIGYARVSTTDQNMARQLEALGKVDKLFTDQLSGKDTNRPGLQAMLDFVREDDILRVKSIDRLGRSARDLLNILDELDKRGVTVVFTDTPLFNKSTKEGQFALTMFAAMAELERETIRERQAEGIALAKQRGVYERKPKLSQEQCAEIRRLAEEEVPKSKIAKKFGVGKTTIYAVLNKTGLYAE